MGVGPAHVIFEVVLSVASGRDFSNSRGLFNFLDSGGFFSRNRSPFLLTTAFFLEMAFLAAIVIGDVCPVPNSGLLACPLRLGGVDVHWSRVVSASGTLLLAFFLVVSLVVVAVVGFSTFLLLSASVLSFVDTNGYSDIFI